MTDTDRHRLSFLAAGTNAAIEFEIRTDHRDLAKYSRPVTDEHCTFDRSGQLSFLDEIGLVHGENEFARRNVDLAAAEVRRVNAFVYRSYDLLGIVLACQHVGIGHARHRDMCKRLPAAIAGRCNPHQACIQLVLHVAAKDAVFDQHVVLPLRALVIDGKRSTTICECSVIDNRAKL